MKRILTPIITGAMVATLVLGGSTASAALPKQGAAVMTTRAAYALVEAKPKVGRWKGQCSGWQMGEFLTSPQLFNAAPVASRLKMLRLITCVFDWLAPGNSSTARYVAERESGLLPWAYNSSSGCMGLFQHIEWEGRMGALRQRWFTRSVNPNVDGHVGWWDPRANAIIAARMVAASGWGAWSTV